MLLTTTAYFTSDKVVGPGHLALDTFSPGLEISQGSGQGVHLLTVAFGSEQGGRVSDDDDEDGGEERRNILLRPETDRRKKLECMRWDGEYRAKERPLVPRIFFHEFFVRLKNVNELVLCRRFGPFSF